MFVHSLHKETPICNSAAKKTPEILAFALSAGAGILGLSGTYFAKNRKSN